MLVVVECKAVEKLTNEHRAQLYNYMRITKKRAGVLVNFAPAYMELERYLYDPDTNEIMTFKGETIEISFSRSCDLTPSVISFIPSRGVC